MLLTISSLTPTIAQALAGQNAKLEIACEDRDSVQAFTVL